MKTNEAAWSALIISFRHQEKEKLKGSKKVKLSNRSRLSVRAKGFVKKMALFFAKLNFTLKKQLKITTK